MTGLRGFYTLIHRVWYRGVDKKSWGLAHVRNRSFAAARVNPFRPGRDSRKERVILLAGHGSAHRRVTFSLLVGL